MAWESQEHYFRNLILTLLWGHLHLSLQGWHPSAALTRLDLPEDILLHSPPVKTHRHALFPILQQGQYFHNARVFPLCFRKGYLGGIMAKFVHDRFLTGIIIQEI